MWIRLEDKSLINLNNIILIRINKRGKYFEIRAYSRFVPNERYYVIKTLDTYEKATNEIKNLHNLKVTI